MSVQETYNRTMKAEGQEEIMDFDKPQQYTLPNELIRDLYEHNTEVCSHKGLNEEQTIDSFVLLLVDRGMVQEEAEEVAEIYDRTGGEFFNQDDDPDSPSGPDEDELDEDEFDDDEGWEDESEDTEGDTEDDDIIEV